MEESWSDINISLDLVDAALRHIHFLDNVDNHEKILNEHVLRHALRRYEQLWLPMAAKHSDVSIAAPIDIAWMWYCHTLSPKEYRHDCRKLVQKTLNHECDHEDTVIQNRNNAIELWYATYPKEGFNIIRSGDTVVGEKNNVPFTSSLSVDLVEIALSQIHFCYQVALPHFRDVKYLESALVRYKQFLMLKKIQPDEFLTPSVDVLLMWFTHMAHPLAYAVDTKQLLGKVLSNNVKLKAERVDDKFVLARQNTRELWKRISTEEMIRPGSVFRGQERSRELRKMTEGDVKSACMTSYKVQFSHIELSGLPSTLKKFKLRLQLVDQNNRATELKSLKGKKRKRMWTFSLPFEFVTERHLCVRFSVEQPSSVWCLKGISGYAEGDFQLGDLLKTISSSDRSLSFETDLKTVDNQVLKVVVDGAIEAAVPYLSELYLVAQEYRQNDVCTKDLSSIWGPSALPHSAENRKPDCFIADHKMNNHNGVEIFGVRVIYVQSLLMAGVRILFRDKVVATSHVINSSELPSPGQVAGVEECLTYDAGAGDRAMLIRTYNGDWGLCIGRWVTDEGMGFLEVRFNSLMPLRKIKTYKVKTLAMHFHSFDANMHSGQISINPAQNSLAENLALVFSINVLHVLCSPKQPGKDRQIISKYIKVQFNGDGEIVKKQELDSLSTDGDADPGDSVGGRVDIQTVRVPESACTLLNAAGLKTRTPNNDYIIKQYGSLHCDMFNEAQDIVVEERLLGNQRSKSRDEDVDVSHRRKKKKKRKSKMKLDEEEDGESVQQEQQTTSQGQISLSDDVENRKHLEKISESQMSINVDPAVIKEATIHIGDVAEKRKRKKKKKRSKVSEDDKLTSLGDTDDLAPVEVVRGTTPL